MVRNSYAAGHRSCAECRRPAYKLFNEDWSRSFPQQLDLSAKTIDYLLHATRLNDEGSQRIWHAKRVPHRYVDEPSLPQAPSLPVFSCESTFPMARLTAAMSSLGMPFSGRQSCGR